METILSDDEELHTNNSFDLGLNRITDISSNHHSNKYTTIAAASASILINNLNSQKDQIINETNTENDNNSINNKEDTSIDENSDSLCRSFDKVINSRLTAKSNFNDSLTEQDNEDYHNYSNNFSNADNTRQLFEPNGEEEEEDCQTTKDDNSNISQIESDRIPSALNNIMKQLDEDVSITSSSTTVNTKKKTFSNKNNQKKFDLYAYLTSSNVTNNPLESRNIIDMETLPENSFMEADNTIVDDTNEMSLPMAVSAISCLTSASQASDIIDFDSDIDCISKKSHSKCSTVTSSRWVEFCVFQFSI
jgi:hypothetical protein